MTKLKKIRNDQWLTRLIKAIEDSGRSYREISLGVGLGENYVAQMVTSGKRPSVDAVLAICSQLEISSSYILTGIETDAAAEELLSRYAELSESERKSFLDFLRIFDTRRGREA